MVNSQDCIGKAASLRTAEMSDAKITEAVNLSDAKLAKNMKKVSPKITPKKYRSRQPE